LKISKFDFKKFLKHNKRNTFCFGFASQLLLEKLRAQSVKQSKTCRDLSRAQTTIRAQHLGFKNLLNFTQRLKSIQISDF